jgi:NAD(P)-dependent dehydrogenase (short-subunit alcohol dehydrogenase family)
MMGLTVAKGPSGEVIIRGKVVVITGGTSGIGRIAAEKLADMGARLVLVARDRERGGDTLARLRQRGPETAHCAHYADLSRLAELKRVGAEIAAAEPRIDVLVNNAGAIFAQRQLTEDGLERTFATNHMSYFVLTHCLRERLLAAAPARIICTASNAHQGQNLDFADLQMANDYRATRAYGRSKLANILFTRELTKRLAGTGVTANAVRPGFVATRFGSGNSALFVVAVRIAMLYAGRAERAADTIVYLASAPELANVSGGYFFHRAPATPSAAAQDDAAARRLWTESERLAGIA